MVAAGILLTGQAPEDALHMTTLPLEGGGTSVAAALATTLERTLDPGVLLAMRDPRGTWDTTLVGLERDRHARPIVLVDPDAGTIAVAATSPGNGGAIYYKRAPLDRIQFVPAGRPARRRRASIAIDH